MNIVQEHITHPDRAYRVLRLERLALRGGRHRHRQLELTWIERGTGLRCVGDSVQPYVDGDMVLLGPHLPHAWSSAGSGAQALQTATVLQFPPELLDAQAIPELAPLRALADRAGRGLLIDGPARSALAAVLKDLPARKGLAGVAAVMELLDLLARNAEHLVPLASRAATRTGVAHDDHDRRVARVVQWVQRHLASELTVEAAAKLVHVTPAAFSRFFSREVGKSFIQYVNDVRCGQACLALRESDQPVARIAQACGFETMSHFNRQFKLRTGMSPREFRRGA